MNESEEIHRQHMYALLIHRHSPHLHVIVTKKDRNKFVH